MAEIKLNPKLPVSESAGDHGITGLDGSLDSGTHAGLTAIVVDVTSTKETKAPENSPSTWSADNPY